MARRRIGWGNAVIGLSMAAAVALGAGPCDAIEYHTAPGLQVTGMNLEMKTDGDGEFCFVTVAVKNGTGKDQVLEIALDSDDGYSVITYSGGPNRKATKAGATEKSEFKTILRRLPKDVTISIKPAD